MESVLQIALGTILGTSIMTLFSYLISNWLNKQFKEPLLLNILLQRSKFVDKDISPLSGWILHYAVGAIMVSIYHLIWTYTSINPTILIGSIFGFISGFPAVAVWKAVFTMHSNPPNIDFKAHYMQLIIAHILFGIGAAAGYQIVKKLGLF